MGPPPPPRRHTYRTVVEESPRIVEAEQTPPRSMPPQGEVSFRGPGWKLSMPVAFLMMVGTALGARLLPAQNSADAGARAEFRLEAVRNAEFRQEMRESMRQLEARLSRQEDTLHNYRALLEERLKRIEAK